MKSLDALSMVLIIIGGINWGLVGAFEFNLVDEIFGEGSGISRAIYVLVGLAALYALVPLGRLLSDARREA